MPAVSVIIPNYNHEQYLRKRIASVLDQSFQDFEIILLDDCSSDNSKKIIEQYRDNKKVSAIIYNQVNSGSTFKQWKKGIEQAKGDFIWIAESDDYAGPDFLSLLINPFHIYPGLEISYCRSIDVDEHDHELGLTLHADNLDKVRWTKDYVEEGATELKHYLKYRNTIPNASAVLFKKPVSVDNLLRTDMRYCGDWFFWRALLQEDESKIAYTSKPLNFFRTHINSTRSLAGDSSINRELQRFREYKSFVPRTFVNPFDNRYNWMVSEWIDRGVATLVKKTRYYYIPLLHPALVIRYYLHLAKKYLFLFK